MRKKTEIVTRGEIVVKLAVFSRRTLDLALKGIKMHKMCVHQPVATGNGSSSYLKHSVTLSPGCGVETPSP
jgi:hypothetical protein